jgi:hypothetical protein
MKKVQDTGGGFRQAGFSGIALAALGCPAPGGYYVQVWNGTLWKLFRSIFRTKYLAKHQHAPFTIRNQSYSQ